MNLDLYRPTDRPASTVVVAIHGCCGDRRDLATTSRSLAAAGFTVVNADVHSVRDGGGWPTTYLDVACAVAWARERAGEGESRVAVLGWSDGALVASAVAFGWSTWQNADQCAVPPGQEEPEMVIGIVGNYGWPEDPPAVTAALVDWFGGAPGADGTGWERGNPSWWPGRAVAPSSEFVLVGSARDRSMIEFAELLQQEEISVEVRTVEGVDALSAIQTRQGPGVAVLEAVISAVE